MYKTKQNYLKFQSHDIFGDKFQSYPKEMQATYWYQVWWIINHFETMMNGVDFEHHNQSKIILEKWEKLWPFQIRNFKIGNAPGIPKTPHTTDLIHKLGEDYNFNTPAMLLNRTFWKKDWFSYQVIYGTTVDLFKQVLKVSDEDIKAFLKPLADYKPKDYILPRIRVVSGFVSLADYFMKTKDMWIQTKEFGDWREKDNLRKIEQFKKYGEVSDEIPEDYPLDRTKILDTRKLNDRWKREKPFLENEYD